MEAELQLIEKQVHKAQINRIDPEKTLDLLMFSTQHSPTGVIVQEQDLVEWLFLLHTNSRTLNSLFRSNHLYDRDWENSDCLITWI